MSDTVYATSSDDAAAQAVLHRYYNGPNNGPLDRIVPLVSIALIIGSVTYALRSGEAKGGAIFFGYTFLAMIIMVIFDKSQSERDLDKMIKAGRTAKLDPILIKLWDRMRDEADIALDASSRLQALAELYHVNRFLGQHLGEYRRSSGADRRNHVAYIRAALRPHIERLGHVQDAQYELEAGLPQITAGPTRDAVQRELATMRQQQH